MASIEDFEAVEAAYEHHEKLCNEVCKHPKMTKQEREHFALSNSYMRKYIDMVGSQYWEYDEEIFTMLVKCFKRLDKFIIKLGETLERQDEQA
jgi:hypothetical protein